MENCKVPIQEDHRTFLKKQNNEMGNWKIAFVAAFLLLMVMCLMIGFTVQSINNMNELRQEIEYLKVKTIQPISSMSEIRQEIMNLQKKIENSVSDLRQEIDDRKEKKIDNDIREDVDYLKLMVANLQKKIDEHNDRDGLSAVLDDENEYNDYNDTVEDYYDADDEYEAIDDSEYNDPTGQILQLTGDQFTKDAKTATPTPRAKRSIIGYDSDGNPINSGYQDRRKTGKNYYSTQPTTGSFSYPYYQRSYQEHIHTTTSPRSLHSRPFQVNSEEDQHLQYNSALKTGDSHSSQENPNVDFVDPYTGHTRHRQRRLELDEHHVRTGRMRPLPAAHFSGDTTKYVLGQHTNFHGNGKLSHHQKTFVDWRESSWFHVLGMDQHFSMNDGVLTIKEPGLYFIYAQIYYFDEHDINGYRVYRNDSEMLLQCTTMTHSVDKVMKGNTCFTAGVEHLSENDRISLGDVAESRVSLFEPGKSFFGVVKLGDVKIK